MACAPSVSCETTAACLISNSTSGYSSGDTLCNIHDRVMFHRCGVDCGRQGKCIQPGFNVRLNSCCCFFTGSLSCLQVLCCLNGFLYSSVPSRQSAQLPCLLLNWKLNLFVRNHSAYSSLQVSTKFWSNLFALFTDSRVSPLISYTRD